MPIELKARDYFKNIAIAVDRPLGNTEALLHTHTFMELAIITAGSAIHFTSTDSYEIRTGDCFVLDGEHGYRDCQNMKLLNIMFNPEELPIPWNEGRKIPGYHAFFAIDPKYRKEHTFRIRLRLSPTELSIVTTIAEKLESELKFEQPGFEMTALAYFMELICFLSRTYSRIGHRPIRELSGFPEAMSYLERNYAENVSISNLTEIAGVSEKVLCKVFKEATGHSPIEYLIQLRISHACILLKLQDLSITEIAFRTGFNDSNFFSRQFKKTTGVSPRIFRNSHKKRENLRDA